MLTSSETDLTRLKVDFERADSKVDQKTLMLNRSLAQQLMIRYDNFDLPIALIDSDILINGSIESLFKEDFDVALTWRKSVNMPINGGLMLLNNHRPEVARKFIDDFVAIYCERYLDAGDWYGDQLALRDICKVTWREMRDRKMIEVNGCKILFLPCEEYNYSPENKYRALINPITHAAILHFKGNRKRLIKDYWVAHLQLYIHNNLLARAHAYVMRRTLALKAACEVRVGVASMDE